MAGSGSLISQSAVTVDTTVGGVLIAAANANRDAVIIRNNGDDGGVIVYLGGSGVTTADGMPLENGASAGVPGASLTIRGSAEVRGIVAAGSQEVRVLEVAD